MSNKQDFASLLPVHWRKEVEGWVRDDCPSFDIGGLVVGEKLEEAYLFGKSDGVLAGSPFFEFVFEHLGCTVEWRAAEGDQVAASKAKGGKVVVAIVRGPARFLLLGERTALNTLSRASGVATEAAKAVAVAKAHGWHGHLAGTRKTTPGFRVVEKYALLVGGAATHRLDLSNMVMLKDNHVWSAGSITAAVQQAKRAAGFSSKIEVEARTLEEGVEAAAAGADIVMLDNMAPPLLKTSAAALKQQFPHLLVEASGGITQESLPHFFSPCVDVISRGNLTQGYPVLDFSLKIARQADKESLAATDASAASTALLLTMPPPPPSSSAAASTAASSSALFEAGIGVVGLGVMGSSLAMNLAEKLPCKVAGLDLDQTKVAGACARAEREGLASRFNGYSDLGSFVQSLASPRRIILLVPAGRPVDAALQSLSKVLSKGDVVMDGGNEWYENTERRQAALLLGGEGGEGGGVHYLGCGVSGGEEGARVGPSLMAGGPKAAYDLMEPALTAIAARTPQGKPCLAYLGDGGAGNYVKMVHNGIEYGDMQMIGESYDCLKTVCGLSNGECAAVFEEWGQGPLGSFLLEITAAILATPDDDAAAAAASGGKGWLVDKVLDQTGSKGTGKWTVQDAADRGVPVNIASAALNARFVSSLKSERTLASSCLAACAPPVEQLENKALLCSLLGVPPAAPHQAKGQAQAPEFQAALVKCLGDAMYCAKLCSYAQGLALIGQAATDKGWHQDTKDSGDTGNLLASTVRCWQGGCIIRAKMLNPLERALSSDPALPNVLLHPDIAALLTPRVGGWRKAVALCALSGVPCPALADALAYFDAYRSKRLNSAALVQAQRDCFGGHTYLRNDKEGTFHSKWGGV
mmetsp:Transcript_38876/g.76625  ORF Transcript_38876/g.76625 Transcript_38876/m.76625 type:complete len:866 (-) Transcript_38876:256-2853(-)